MKTIFFDFSSYKKFNLLIGRLCILCLFAWVSMVPMQAMGINLSLAKHEKTGMIVLQQHKPTITGKVTDSTGQVLAGVSVMIKGNATRGTTTDLNGMYVIEVPDGNVVLVFTLVGYKTVEVPVEKNMQINIMMGLSTSSMEEVVVVGFGTQKKKEVVGSVTNVKPADLIVPASNLTTAFAGRISGMIAYQRTGEPGRDDADFFIRGVTSFGIGKVNPLILIDGVELTSTDLARLKADDIDQFSVLKDATATAVYGARGANGVILVTTKKGKEGRAKVDLRAEGSISMPTRNIEFADPITYMKLYNEAYIARNPFNEPYYSRQEIDAREEGRNPVIYPVNDWRKIMFKEYSLNHRYNMSVHGGGKIARYYVTGSFSQDNGMLKVDKRNNFNSNANFKTYTLHSNVDVDLTKTTQMIVRLTGNFDNYTGPRQGASEIYNMVVRSNPIDIPAYYPVDSAHAYVTHIMFGGRRDRSYLNPYAEMVSGYKDYDRSLMMVQLEFKQDLNAITKGLNFHILMNANKNSRYEVQRSYNPFYYGLSYLNPNSGEYSIDVINTESGTEYLSYTNVASGRVQASAFYTQGTLSYNRLFNDKHNISGMLVGIARSLSTGTATQLQLSLPSRNLGVSGRASYGYDNRYFAEFNFGYNASERFDKAHRWGFFPSAGVAWTVSNEKFMENISHIISNMKLRATYWVVGNDAIGDANDRFFYLSNVNMDASGLGTTFGQNWEYYRSGVQVTRYANPNITWEIAYKTNVGLDMQLFKTVQVQADFYQEVRKNILMNRAAIPTTMGLAADVRANLGEAKGRGMDLSINTNHRFKSGVWLQTLLNFTYATAKYKVFEEPLYDKEYWLSRVGTKLNQPWGFLAERLFVDDAEVANSPEQNFGGTRVLAGDIKYKDINRDGRITDLDQIPLGYPVVPEIVYGFGFTAGYKGFDISTFFQGLGNESFWMGGSTGPRAIEPFVGGKQILKVFADDHYSLDNPDVYALYPRLSDSYQSNNMNYSTWWLRNGKFLRLKQAEIGYTLPKATSDRIRMNKLRIYFNGSNLLTFSQFKLWDVEMGGYGLGYPVQRVFNLGINASF